MSGPVCRLDATGRMRALVDVVPAGRAQIGDYVLDGRGDVRQVVQIWNANTVLFTGEFRGSIAGTVAAAGDATEGRERRNWIRARARAKRAAAHARTLALEMAKAADDE